MYGYMVGYHCSGHVDRKATARKTEKVLVLLVGRSKNKVRGCHTHGHSTRVLCMLQGNKEWKQRTSSIPTVSSSHTPWHPTSDISFNVFDGRLLPFNNKIWNLGSITTNSEFFKAFCMCWCQKFWVYIYKTLKEI